MRRGSFVSALLIFGLACGRGSPPAPSVVASVTPNAPVAVASAPTSASSIASSAAAPAELVPSPVTCAANATCAIAWRTRGHAFRAELATEDNYTVCVVKPESGETERLSLGPGTRVQRIEVVDASGDGLPDLAFRVEPTKTPEQIAYNTILFAAREETGPERSGGRNETGPERSGGRNETSKNGPTVMRFDELYWTERALGIVPADRALRGIGPATRVFVMPDDATSAETVVHRVRFATLENVRSLLAERGLDVCQETIGNAKPHGRKCKHYAPKALTAEALAAVSLPMGADPTEEPHDPGLQPCARVGQNTVCIQGTGGPANLKFVFTGRGTKMRMIELTFSAYEST